MNTQTVSCYCANQVYIFTVCLLFCVDQPCFYILGNREEEEKACYLHGFRLLLSQHWGRRGAHLQSVSMSYQTRA